MAEDVVYKMCAAIMAREAEIPWEERPYTGIAHGHPRHPDTERWFGDGDGRLPVA